MQYLTLITYQHSTNLFNDLGIYVKKIRHLDWQVQRYITACGKQCFKFQVSMIWNSLPLLPPPADLNDISVSLKQRHMY